MTSYASVAQKYYNLCRDRGPRALETKVCATLVLAIHDALADYVRRTHRPFAKVMYYACEVDLSCRKYKVTVFPYVYSHPSTYEILDGLDTSNHSRFKDEKEQ